MHRRQLAVESGHGADIYRKQLPLLPSVINRLLQITGSGLYNSLWFPSQPVEIKGNIATLGSYPIFIRYLIKRFIHPVATTHLKLDTVFGGVAAAPPKEHKEEVDRSRHQESRIDSAEKRRATQNADKPWTTK